MLVEEGATEVVNVGIDGGVVQTQREEGCFWIVTGVPNAGVEYNWADGILYVTEDVPAALSGCRTVQHGHTCSFHRVQMWHG